MIDLALPFSWSLSKYRFWNMQKNPDVEMQGFSHKKIDSSHSYEEVLNDVEN